MRENNQESFQRKDWQAKKLFLPRDTDIVGFLCFREEERENQYSMRRQRAPTDLTKMKQFIPQELKINCNSKQKKNGEKTAFCYIGPEIINGTAWETKRLRDIETKS